MLYFDNPIAYWFGDGDYFEIPYHDALNSATMSIEAVVYPMSSGYYTSIAERVRDGHTYETITYLGLDATGYHTGNYPLFHLEIGGVSKDVRSPVEVPLNAWSHIVGTYDGNNMRLYVDGTLVAAELGVGGPRDTGSNPFYLGHAPSTNHYFNGFYSAFKLYDRALTGAEIAAEFEDADPPDTTITDHPLGISDDDTPTFAFNGDDGDGSGVASFECRIVSMAYSTCESPLTLMPLTDGPHTFRVRAIDVAGNVDPTPDTDSFQVDTTPPSTTIDGRPGAPERKNDKSYQRSPSPGPTRSTSIHFSRPRSTFLGVRLTARAETPSGPSPRPANHT